MIISLLYATITMLLIVFCTVFVCYFIFCIIVGAALAVYYVALIIYKLIRKVLNKRTSKLRNNR